MLKTPERKNVKAALEGIVQTAMHGQAASVELPAAEALFDMVDSTDEYLSRYAVRSFALVASHTESADTAQSMGKKLANLMFHPEEVHAKIAIRGLVRVSAEDDHEFRDQTWQTLLAASQKPLANPVRSEVQKAIIDLSRQREEQIQASNNRIEAKNLAPAA